MRQSPAISVELGGHHCAEPARAGVRVSGVTGMTTRPMRSLTRRPGTDFMIVSPSRQVAQAARCDRDAIRQTPSPVATAERSERGHPGPSRFTAGRGALGR